MKKVLVAVAVVASLVLVAAALAEVAPKAFAVGTGEVTLSKDGKSARIVNDPGESGEVERAVISKKLLRKLVHLTFVSTGDVASGSPGSPRWQIPVNTDGDVDTMEGFAFIDAEGCGAEVGDNPTGAATVVSPANDACHVSFQGVDYANWQAFCGKLGAHPTYTLARHDAGFRIWPFIVADQPGEYLLGKIRVAS